MKVYLDDVRECPEGFLLVRNVEELKNVLFKNEVDVLSLDHDLGVDGCGVELANGYDFVKWYCEYGGTVREIYLHTDNPVGRDNMYQTLLGARRRGFIPSETEIYWYGYEK